MTRSHAVAAVAVAVLLLPASTAVVSVAAADSGSVPAVHAVSLPAIGAVSVAEVRDTSVTLQASILPSLLPSVLRIEYGPTPALGALTAGVDVPASALTLVRAVTVTGLEPGTSYVVRPVVANALATVAGSGTVVTTLGGAVSPADPRAPSLIPSDTGAPSSPDDDAPDPAASPPAAPPVLGSRVWVAPSRGAVRVRLPGDARSAPLGPGATIPTGSVVDTRGGRVEMTTALPSGRTQTAAFWGGLFTVRQTRSGLVRLILPRARGCARPARASRGYAQDVRPRRARGRRPALWGRDHRGRYRTEGSNSAATVRGTTWLVVNRCDGTLTRVREGSVVVRDLARARDVVIRVGGSYLARPAR